MLCPACSATWTGAGPEIQRDYRLANLMIVLPGDQGGFDLTAWQRTPADVDGPSSARYGPSSARSGMPQRWRSAPATGANDVLYPASLNRGILKMP
jgi:hypothetical protein